MKEVLLEVKESNHYLKVFVEYIDLKMKKQ